jgi:PAS domain S-box-containing protein
MEVFEGGRPDEPLPVRWSHLASLRTLLEKIPALLWVTDTQLRVTFLTGAALQKARVAVTEFTGKPASAVFASHPRNGRAAAAHDEALGGASREFEMEWNGRDMEAHVEPIRETDGAIAGVIGIALDVTDRLVAETALRLSEQSYRSLVEEAPYGICRATESGQLLQVNRAMLEMLGYAPGSEADLLVRDLPLIFASPERFCSCRGDLLSDRTIQGLETVWICKDGQEIQVRLGGRAIRNQAGEVLYLDLLAENVTEKKELEARLSQAQKMQAIGQLAGGVAHDFNNLLTVIGGQVEVVLDETVDQNVRQRLEDVKQAADRAAVLTRQLLAFSRRQVLQSKVVDVNRLIEDAGRMLTRLVRANIAFTFTPGPTAGFVRTDPHQMEQVLMNLVVNAQDAMPQGGQLTIETASVRIEEGHEGAENQGGMEPGPYVLITVRDTGHGMDRDIQARIFEPFFTTKKTGEGTGLGLSMVYGVVKQCGGHIQLDSHPGKGTAFRIYLPCVEGPEPARYEAAPLAAPRGSETILLAEDEEAVRELVLMYLNRLGYHVLAASDGPAAIELARAFSGRIDLLLSDLVLPKMGGRELARILAGSIAQLKVIFISGYAGHTASGKDLELPEAYFLPKPFSLQRLATSIREVLDSTETRITPAGA